ncbi:MAG: hypothetical protein AABY63_01175 [candidate division NC10 bacterium]
MVDLIARLALYMYNPSPWMGEGLGGGDDRSRLVTLPRAPSRQGRGDF